MWHFFCLVLRCVALRSLRSLHSLRRLLSASGVDVAFALAVRFCLRLRCRSTLSTLLLLLPLLLRPPLTLTLARTCLPLVYPASVAAYWYVHVIHVYYFLSPLSALPSTLHPWNFSRGAVWRGGAWSARTRHGTLRRCRRVRKAVRLVAVVPRRVGAVPGSAGFSNLLIFFLPSGCKLL